jgi:hypothetical protein
MGVERRERNGKVVYLARPHINGRRLRSRAFDRERDAKRYVRDQESRRHRHATDVRVADYVAAFLEDHAVATRGPTRGRRKSPRTIGTYRYALKRFLGEYGNRRLDDFDRPLLGRLRPPIRCRTWWWFATCSELRTTTGWLIPTRSPTCSWPTPTAVPPTR